MRYAKRYTSASNTYVKDNLLRTGTRPNNKGKIISPITSDEFRDANLMAEIDPETGKLHEDHLPEMVATVDTTNNVISIKKDGEVIVIPVVYKDPESGKIDSNVLPTTVVQTVNGKITTDILPNSVSSKNYITEINPVEETYLKVADKAGEENDDRYIKLKDVDSVFSIELLLTAVKIDTEENNMVTFKCNFSALTDASGKISASDAIFEITSNIGNISFIGKSLPELVFPKDDNPDEKDKIYIRVLPNEPSVWYTSIKIIKVN